jgi:hypothetical protein
LKRYFYGFAVIFVLLAAILAADRTYWFIDDRNHPDGVLLADAFAAARRENRTDVNVIAIAGGNWLAMCLAGQGQNPQDTLLQFGRKNRIRVPTVQRIRSWLYVGLVPKDEMAVVFVTGSYSIRTRRLPNYTGNPNFKTACARRTDPGLTWR